MKSFLEFNMSNEAGVDLSSFDTIIKSNATQIKLPLEVKSDREFKSFGEFLEEDIDWSSFHTIIKPQEVVPEKPKDGIDGKHGKDGKTPNIKIGSVKSGSRSSVTNSGTSLDVVFDFVLEKGKDGKDGVDGTNGVDGKNGKDGKNGIDGVNGKDGKEGKQGKIGLTGLSGTNGVDGKNGTNGKDGKNGVDGINGKDGSNGVDGKDGTNGIDGYTPIKGVDYVDGKDGVDGYTPIKNKDYFDGVNGVDGKDGYTPIKGVDYIDGKDGINGIDGTNGLDGKTPSIRIGKVSVGEVPSVENWGTSLDAIFDFVLPEAIKGADGKQGLQGERGEKGDKGETGNIPDHEVDDFGNIRFETPDGNMGDWIDINSNIRKVVTQQIKHHNKNQFYGSGGGSNLDFIVGSDTYTNVRYLNFDTESLLVTQNNGVLTIGINPSYIGVGGNVNYTFDYFKLENDNLYDFILSKPLVFNSEVVILNGAVLTFGEDYDIINNTIMIDHRFNTLFGWNLTIKYAYSTENGTSGIGFEAIENGFYVR